MERTGAETMVEVLLDLTGAVQRSPSLEEALRAAAEAVMALLPCEHASVRVLDGEGLELLASARAGEGREARPSRFRRGEGVLGWVVEHGRTARVDDAETDPRFAAKAGQGFSIRSLVAAPLWSGGQVMGVLGATAAAAGAFSEHDEGVALLVSNCAAPAIDKARLERIAITDPLTLTYSHRYLDKRLRAEIKRAARHDLPLSLLLIDLDRFKAVNDTHGHGVGDRVLRSFAERVRAAVRETDVLVRRGGDEFVLIMPHTDGDRGVIVGERVREAIASAPLDGGEVEVAGSVSVGVASLLPGESAEALEARADRAMYLAKGAGRDRVSRAP